MKPILKRSISILLVFIMIVSVFTSCSVNKDDILSLDVEFSDSGTPKILVVSYSEDIFKDEFKKNKIKVEAYNQTQETEKDEETVPISINDRAFEEIETTEITDFSVTVDSAKQLTIKLADGKDSNYTNYNVGVHKDAITVGKYGSGSCAIQSDVKEQVNYSAEISGEYTVGDSNPVITLQLNNTVAVKDIKNDMIALSGLFKSLEIADAKSSGNTLTLTTKGEILPGSSLSGSVSLSEKATESGQALHASCPVAYVGAWTDNSSFKFKNNTLSFDIQLGGDEFNAEKGDKFDSLTVESANKTKATVSTAVKANNLDDSINEITGKSITIPADKLKGSEPITFLISASKAKIGMVIDYIDSTDTVDTYRATAALYALNGSFDTLTEKDITFDGDFSDGTKIDSIKQNAGLYDITFTFKKKNINIDDLNLSGKVTVADGKLKNLWGTTQNAVTSDISYITGISKGETWDAITSTLTQLTTTLEPVTKAARVVSGIAGAVTGVKSILEICGAIESTDSKIDALREQMDMLSTKMDNLSTKVDGLGEQLAKATDKIVELQYKTLYSTYSTNWNNFMNSQVAPLTTAIDKYTTAYNEYMLDYIGKSGSSDKITVYIDEDGNATLPGTMNGYAIDGKRIISADAYHLTEPLTDIKNKIQKENRGRLYAGYWNDITAYIEKDNKRFTTDNNHSSSTISAKQYLLSVQMNAALYALKKVGTENILAAYSNFCYAIVGSSYNTPNSSAAIKPLKYYELMLSTFYNFGSEAQNDLNLMHTYISSLMIKGHSIARLANDYSTASSNFNVDQANKKAKEWLTNNKTTYKTESGIQYSYLMEDYIQSKRLYPDRLRPNCQTCLYNNRDEYYFTNRIIDSTLLNTMKSRYAQLKSAGITTANTFSAYLEHAGLIDKDLSSACLVTSKPQKEKIPMDNTVTLHTVGKLKGTKYFTVGDSIKIGSNGPRKAKYYSEAFQIMGEAIALDGNVTITRLFAEATYHEHFTFASNEHAILRFKCSEPLLVLESA